MPWTPGVENPTSRLTVGAYLDRWIEGVPARVEQSTAADYADTVRLHLKPGTRLEDADQAVGLRSERSVGSQAEGRVQRQQHPHHAHRAALGAPPGGAGGVCWSATWLRCPIRLGSSNLKGAPCRLPRRRACWMPPRDDRLEALYAITLTFGLRRGEALGLSWSDIDFEARLAACASSDPSGTAPAEEAQKESGRRTHLVLRDLKTKRSQTNAPPDAGARRSASSPSGTPGSGATRRRARMGRFGSGLHDQERHADRSRQLRPLLPPVCARGRARALDATRAATFGRLDHARPGNPAVGRLRGARARLGGDHQGRLRHLVGDEKKEATEAITDVLFDTDSAERASDAGAG